jgi:hypothetical protein
MASDLQEDGSRRIPWMKSFRETASGQQSETREAAFQQIASSIGRPTGTTA